MAIRPLQASADVIYNPRRPYIADDFEDGAIHSPRSGGTSVEYSTPEDGAGQAVITQSRPDWRSVSGNVTAQTTNGNTRMTFPGTAGPHEVETPSTLMAGTWEISFRYAESDGSTSDRTEALVFDPIWDPVAGEGWRMYFIDDLKFKFVKQHSDGVDSIATGDWKASWDDINTFETFLFERRLDGEWDVFREGHGLLFEERDGWLPRNHRQVRVEADGINNGTNQFAKEVEYINVSADPTFPIQET